MKLRLVVAATLIAQWLAASPGEAAFVIRDDLGGPLGDYFMKFGHVRDSGEPVIIDGRCFSACTIVTGLIPPDRICVTARAMLGFHAAQGPAANGELAINSAATQLMYDLYPPSIKTWLQQRGGLGPDTIILSGKDLTKYYSLCP